MFETIRVETKNKYGVKISNIRLANSETSFLISGIVSGDKEITPIEIGIVFLNQKREVLYYTKTEPIEPDYGVIYETYNLRYLEDCMLSSVSDITQIILYPIKKHGKFGEDLEW